jgi:hypothetical protein
VCSLWTMISMSFLIYWKVLTSFHSLNCVLIWGIYLYLHDFINNYFSLYYKLKNEHYYFRQLRTDENLKITPSKRIDCSEGMSLSAVMDSLQRPSRHRNFLHLANTSLYLIELKPCWQIINKEKYDNMFSVFALLFYLEFNFLKKIIPWIIYYSLLCRIFYTR